LRLNSSRSASISQVCAISSKAPQCSGLAICLARLRQSSARCLYSAVM
jgi:hypothetical protein